MGDILRNRYIRQVQVKEFGEEAQRKLADARVLVVGAGALGCPALMYLTAAGVGTIGVLDADEVDITNLHRQIIYTNNDLDKPKVNVAAERLKLMNPEVKINQHFVRLHRDNALGILKEYDLVIDCTDNFPSKFLVNDACVMLGKPCIIGGVLKFSGQLSVYNYNGGPTYRCFLVEEPDPLEAPSCAEAGVIGMVPGIIGTMQALEALKIITGIGITLSGRLLNLNGLNMQFSEFELFLNPSNLMIDKLSEHNFSCTNSILAEREIDKYVFLEMLNDDNPPIVIAFAEDGNPIDVLAYHWETIPLYELPNKVPDLNQNCDIVLICEYGLKSISALRFLVSKHNFHRVFHLKDGVSSLRNLL